MVLCCGGFVWELCDASNENVHVSSQQREIVFANDDALS